MEVVKKATGKYVALLVVLLVGVGAGVGYYFWPKADNVASYGGKTISSEVYKPLQMMAAMHVVQEITKTNKALADQIGKDMYGGAMGKACDATVDGKTVESMIAEASKDEVYRFAAVEARSDELKLKLPKEDQEKLDQDKKRMEEAEKAAADAKAKGKQTAREAEKAAEAKKRDDANFALTKNFYERNALLKHDYEKLSDAELKKSFDSKYVKIRTFVVPYNVAKGTEEETEKSDAKADTEEEKKRKEEAAAKEAKEEAKKRAESYIKDIEKLGFAKVAAKEEARLQAASGQKSESKETEEEKIKRLSQAQVISKERFVGMESFLKAIEGASLNKAVLYDAAEGHEFYVFEVVEKTDEEFKKEKENLIQVLKKDEFDANLLKYGKEEVKVKFNDSALAKQSPRDIEFGFGGF